MKIEVAGNKQDEVKRGVVLQSWSGTEDAPVVEADALDGEGLADRQNTEQREEGQLTFLSGLLRYVGVAILLFAAFSYLRQGWQNAESLWRYYSFLSFTVVLAGSGIACGLGLRETKGARTLLGVSVSFLPAHFAQLGALLYGALFGAVLSVPSYLRFETTASKAMLTIFVASITLLPMAYAAFSSLARKRAFELTAIFAIANFLLLIPSRDHLVVFGLASLATILLAILDIRFLVKDAVLQTFEGALCRIMLYSPVLILLVRNIMLYDAENILFSCLFAIIALALFCFPKSLTSKVTVLKACEIASFPVASISWVFALSTFWWPQGYNAITIGYGAATAEAGSFLIVCIPMALISFAMSYFSRDGKKILCDLAAACALYGALGAHLHAYGLLAAIGCLSVGAVLSYRGYVRASRLSFYGGATCLASGTYYVVTNLWTILNLAPWMAVASVGLMAVLFSSVIERHFSLLVAQGKLIAARLHRVQ